MYFHSSDVRKLPWRTTKQGVVIESSIYQSALGEMRLQARPVLNFLNDLYPDQLEAVGIVEREVLEGAKVKPLSKLGSSDTAFRVTLPESTSDPAAEFTSIQYQRRRGEIDQIRQCDWFATWGVQRKSRRVCVRLLKGTGVFGMRTEYSFDKVNYSLRPAKQVERKVLVELLHQVSTAMPGYDVRNYTYVGFGSVYYTDFILFS